MTKQTEKRVKGALWTIGATMVTLAAWVWIDGEKKVKEAKQKSEA